MIAIQWEGKVVDQWLRQKEGREPTIFEICPDCWDGIICGDIDPDKLLIPRFKDEPQDKYLYVSEYNTKGKCEICEGWC